MDERFISTTVSNKMEKEKKKCKSWEIKTLGQKINRPFNLFNPFPNPRLIKSKNKR